ncbi:unnamed protein product [Parascedosporium putredinis]|uniref:SsuA/THI5-like domain-containing protein n=1 Tax=Parascedosporium putredinis TaxID=1442378 RepID=A0A9P1H9J8_9PEZI|nr:unnamed protein product [Parascedosporium putredinis]CAI8001038.1 unnamed protein product [Parascedosporium putredinis]
MKTALLLTGIVALLGTPSSGLKVSTSLDWIEYTPQRYAADNFYKGSSPVQISSGGVATIARDNSVDLAANAETQGLKQLSGRRSLRLIYMVCEAQYRIVANKAKGINALEDLKGKRIGTIPGTSAGYFVNKFLKTAGIQPGQYTVASGNACMKAPCGQGTLPQMLQAGQIDAFGLWEMYALYTTAEKLADARIRADIVEFVRALNQTLDVYNNDPKKVFARVAELVRSDADVVEAVWPEHLWTGRWAPDLIDFLVEEDAYLAQEDRRQPIPRADIEKFLDTSILDELGL